MTALITLILVVVLIDLAVLLGWGYDSRDGRDWQPRQRSWDRFSDSGPVSKSVRTSAVNPVSDSATDPGTGTDTLGGWTSSSGPHSRPTSPLLAP